MSYTEAEKADFVPPTCPRCGAPGEQEWVDVMPWHGEEPEFLPGFVRCSERCADGLSYQELREAFPIGSKWRP